MFINFPRATYVEFQKLLDYKPRESDSRTWVYNHSVLHSAIQGGIQEKEEKLLQSEA